MGTNVNLTDVLKKIALNTDFISSAGDKFGNGEKLEFLFISKSEDKTDTVVLRDTSGDSYSISAQNLQGYLTDEEYNALIAENENKKADQKQVFATTQAALQKVAPANSAKAKSGSSNMSEADMVRAEIDKLELQKTTNINSMSYLKTQIEMLQSKIEKSVEEALEAMEEATEEQQKKANEIIEARVKEFKSKKEKGEDVSSDSLASQVKSEIASLGTPQGFTNAMTGLTFANTNLSLLNNLKDQLSNKISLDKELDKQIQDKNNKLAEITAQDVMGFSLDSVDLNGDGKSGRTQFDLFYDKDNDNKINSTNDFVGFNAEKSKSSGWSQLSRLDGSTGAKDGIITADELQQAGIKFAVTDESGKKSVMDVSRFESLFGKIEINTQDSKTVRDGIGNNVPNNFGNDNINKLMGSFVANIGGNGISGYQTRNTQDWLNDNYSDIMSGNNINETDKNTEEVKDPLKDVATYEDMVDEYENTTIPELNEKIQDANSKLNLSQETVDALKELGESTAESEGQAIEQNLKDSNENKISEGDLSNEEKEYIKNAGMNIEDITPDDLKTIQDKIKQEKLEN